MSGASSPARAVASREILDELIAAAVEEVAGNDPEPSNPFRGLYLSDDEARSLAGAREPADVDARLHELCVTLGLDPLESLVLALCAAPEISPRYGRLFGYLHDDLTRKFATPQLVAQLLHRHGIPMEAVLACLDHDRSLRASGAVADAEAQRAEPLAERPLRVRDRIAAWLLGARLDDQHPELLRVLDGRSLPLGRPQLIASVGSALARAAGDHLLVAGPDAEPVVSQAVGRPLLLLRLGDALGDHGLITESRLLCRLDGMQFVLDASGPFDTGDAADVARLLARADMAGLVLTASDARLRATLAAPSLITIAVPRPSLGERVAAWQELAGGDTVEVASKFRLSVEAISRAARVARALSAARGAQTPNPLELDAAAREASSNQVAELAQRMEARWTWDDLILPPRQEEQLRSISSYLRHRDRLRDEWGYDALLPEGAGLRALFAGESGTGKTMAAQVLATELGLDIYRVDLATVVSKYIGETEKNLDRVFDAAAGSNAILFFDEADALFGKRSEVASSHDRYANLETAYLLQRMERYDGAVILATNYRRNIDTAFTRRLDFVIDFPFPDEHQRSRLWRALLPAAAPLHGDVDLALLASRFKLSGGSIGNVVVAAAFLAAEAGSHIGMRQLMRGIAQEFQKYGRLTLETEFEQFQTLTSTEPADPGASP